MPRSSAIRHCVAPAPSATKSLMPQIERVWQANLQVYGADKVWRQIEPRRHRQWRAARSSG